MGSCGLSGYHCSDKRPLNVGENMACDNRRQYDFLGYDKEPNKSRARSDLGAASGIAQIALD